MVNPVIYLISCLLAATERQSKDFERSFVVEWLVQKSYGAARSLTGQLGMNFAGIPDAHDPHDFVIVSMAMVAIVSSILLRWRKSIGSESQTLMLR